MAMKHVSDVQVCRAVQAYQDAVQAIRPAGRGWIVTLDQRDNSEWPPYPYEALSVETGQPEKVCYRAMERACDRGYIEYGVSLRTGWLTKEGKALLENSRG